MAGAERMTIEEVVRDVPREEHGDVIREPVRLVAHGAVEVEVCELIGAGHGERTEDPATRARAGSRPHTVFVDDLPGLGDETDVDLASTHIQSSVQHEHGPPRARSSVTR